MVLHLLNLPDEVLCQILENVDPSRRGCGLHAACLACRGLDRLARPLLFSRQTPDPLSTLQFLALTRSLLNKPEYALWIKEAILDYNEPVRGTYRLETYLDDAGQKALLKRIVQMLPRGCNAAVFADVDAAGRLSFLDPDAVNLLLISMAKNLRKLEVNPPERFIQHAGWDDFLLFRALTGPIFSGPPPGFLANLVEVTLTDTFDWFSGWWGRMGFDGTLGGPFLKLPSLKIFRSKNLSLGFNRNHNYDPHSDLFPIGTSAVEVLDFDGCYVHSSGLIRFVMACQRLKKISIIQDPMPKLSASFLADVSFAFGVFSGTMADMILHHRDSLEEFTYRLSYQEPFKPQDAKPCIRKCSKLKSLCFSRREDLAALEGIPVESLAEAIPPSLKSFREHNSNILDDVLHREPKSPD